ncbi:glycerol-3-phosphate 1-O-acyltransferase PlsY [Pelomicrobium methylotrophicum]|uniref:Glycerol-3-phosphate acyltransferase n=1 Tax=Pelomicrobium methylotrophicum TaxID=2602750 RepID=A0A5C7ENI9_9PROT|nr:glycerol-3-phosphate 1-O-acyltransferase PlsY [Pelomicrobium methylotrophicum]TXF13129.1 glycerol-3-phosphate 1-O-acyltransferase PlsY [Pelomicrobium methylotrophicum]
MATIALAVAAYLLGSIPFAVVVSRVLGLPDPRGYGSGNPGATNVLRTGNKLAAVFTLLGDAGKGAVAVILARGLAPRLGGGEEAVAMAAAAVFLGHLYPIFLRFRGGKGVATAAGVLAALSPGLGLILAGVWIATAALFRFSSLAALTAAGVAPLVAAGFFGWHLYTGVTLLMATLLAWRHRANIQRLIAGTETRIGRSQPTGRHPGA